VNSDKSATRSGLVGRNLTVLDLKTSCRALSASVRWTKTICRCSRTAQPIRKCQESHVSRIGAILSLNDPAPSLNAVSRDKKSASVWQADGPTNFNPIWPRQKICGSATKNRLVCGSLKSHLPVVDPGWIPQPPQFSVDENGRTYRSGLACSKPD